MLTTHELRWFVAQAISDDELRAFACNRTIERRRDEYLIGAGEDRGVKRRSALTLEHKQRDAVLEFSLQLDGRHLRGQVERWSKRWPRQLELDGEWIGVTKRRAIARCGHCRAELTGLHSELHMPAGIEFQTLALETLADDPLPALTEAAGELLRAHPELLARFCDAPSYGYPAWLSRARRACA